MQGARQCGAGWRGIRCQAPAYRARVDSQLSPTFDSTFDGADVRVEVSINGQDYTDGGLTYRYYDTSVWMLHAFHPRGGPLSGNTSIAVSGLRLHPLGDVRCRFGVLNAEVNATITDEHSLACVSPSNWNQRAAALTVDLSITLNGQDYLQAKPHQSTFSYYALDADPTGLSVRRLDPAGGPERGGTLVRVSGSGFIDHGGLLCKFAGEPAVPATRLTSETLRCYSPPRLADTTSALASNASSGQAAAAALPPFDERAVEVTINGQLHAATSSAVPFAYYRQSVLAVSRIYPRGGGRSGGTMVTVWGAGFRELGHGNHSALPSAAGLYCKFGPLSLVPATLASGGGAGAQQLTCASPRLPSTERCDALVVRVTNNADNPPGGDALSSDDVGFTYYENSGRPAGGDDGLSTPYGATLLSHPVDWTGGDVLR